MNPHPVRSLLCAGLALCATLCSAFAQNATIGGAITDAETGRPLAGATVKVVGTYYGAIARRDGTYQIKNMAAGASYTIEVSLIGYAKVQRTGIRLGGDESLTLDFQLKETALAFGKDVVVIGKRPLVDVERTESSKLIAREELEASAVQNITDVVVQQVGVVVTNDQIHVRGGRSYETGYLVDGIASQDPLAGTGFGLQLSAAAVEDVEIITGGFNAEYGQATSGVVKVRTKEGGENYSGSFTYKRGWLVHQRRAANFDEGSTFATDVAELSLGGPLPGTRGLVEGAGPITFFLNVLGNYTDGIAPEFARPERLQSRLLGGSLFNVRQNNGLAALGKLTWNISPSVKIGYSFTGSGALNQNARSIGATLEYVEPEPGYQYRFQYNPAGAITYSHLNLTHALSFQHTLSSSTFYEVKLSRYYSRLLADANGRDYTQYVEPQDIPGVPAQYFETGDTNRLGIIPGDGFYDSGDGDTWHDHFFDDWGVRADLTHIFNEQNTFKGGLDLHIQQMQLAEIYKPWIGPLGLNNDVYRVSPAAGALYAQDGVQFKGLILNVGLRYDFWFPGALADDAIENAALPTITEAVRESYREGTIELFGARMKSRLSPRIGVSHPITNTQMLFFSYGHFTKWPRPQLVYAKLDPQQASSSFQTYGNPDLQPETTISYELGIRNQITEDDALTVKLFYNDKFDYIQRRSFPYNDPRLAGRTFTTYVNGDYARVRGIDAEYEKRIGGWFVGGADVTYSITTGRSSSENEFNAAQGGREETLREDFMPWDRPWQARAYAIFNAGRESEPLGLAFLSESQLYLDFNYQSGKRYTPATPTGERQPNGRPVYETDNTQRYQAVADPRWWLTVKARKFFGFAGVRFTLSLEVENLLDALNSEIINPATGRAYELGDPTPLSWNDPLYPDVQAPVDPYPFNPARYSNRRNLKVGLEAKF